MGMGATVMRCCSISQWKWIAKGQGGSQWMEKSVERNIESPEDSAKLT